MADPQHFLSDQVERLGGSITDPPGGEAGQRWQPDTPLRRQACEAAMRCAVPQRHIFTKCLTPMAEAALAERDCHDALPVAAGTQKYLHVPDTLERLARLAFDGDNHQQAERLFGAAAAVRQRNVKARFPVFQADYARVVAATRDALGQKDFD